MSTAMQMLLVENGQLMTEPNVPLLIIYPEGDCDRFKFPTDTEDKDEWAGKLAHALYDANEMGVVTLHDGKIMLPNGAEFDVEANLDKWSPPSMEGWWF